jgi:hypothetical protein
MELLFAVAAAAVLRCGADVQLACHLLRVRGGGVPGQASTLP